MRVPFQLSMLCLAATPIFAALNVTLTPSAASPQPIGTPITFTATVPGGSTTLNYQFQVAYNGAQVQVAQDYSAVNTFVYAPFQTEGPYTVQVVARDTTTGAGGTANLTYVYSSRVTGTTPVISKTAHPLVALYSAPSCAVGSSMFVAFKNGNVSNETNTLKCNGKTSMNFYVAGMRAQTTYTLTPVTVKNGVNTPGQSGTFTTGAIGPKLQFPTVSVTMPANSQTSTSQGVQLLDYIAPTGINYFPVAYDLAGNVIWYLPELGLPAQNGVYFLRPLPGGNMLVFLNDPSTTARTGQLIREYDLAGNQVKQTSVTNISRALIAQGKQPITDLNHDAILLPNGHIVAIGSQEEIFPAGTQGSTAPVDILGDAIVDLDTNLQLSW